MSKSNVEIDFFRMEKQRAEASNPSSPERAASTRVMSAGGIQSVVSRINPQLLKTVMAAGRARPSGNIGAIWASGEPSGLSNSPPSPTAAGDAMALPVFNPASRCSTCPLPDTAPLTIFYNGTVMAFDVPRGKAEAIMRMAETAATIVGHPSETPEDRPLHEGLKTEADLPIARKKSLQRFFEKRKERVTSASPYPHHRHQLTRSHPHGTWKDQTKSWQWQSIQMLHMEGQ